VDVSPKLKAQMTEMYGEETTQKGIETAELLFEEAERVLKTSHDSPLEEQTAELRDLVKRLLCSAWVHDRILRTVAGEPMKAGSRLNALEQEVRALRYKVARMADPLEDGDEPAEGLTTPEDVINSFLRNSGRAVNT